MNNSPGLGSGLGGPTGSPSFYVFGECAVSKRTTIYVDGFNLYYGALKGGPNRWLDLQRYFQTVRPNDNIQRIHYFTARVKGKSGIDQETYIDALQTLPLVNIVEGKYMRKDIKCRVSSCALVKSQAMMFKHPEEKRTDVNIALQMLDDVYQSVTDQVVLVSGDSDLVPAIHLVKLRFPQCKVIVYVPNNHPNRGRCVELRNAADVARDLPVHPLRHSQLPMLVTSVNGTTYKRPSNW